MMQSQLSAEDLAAKLEGMADQAICGCALSHDVFVINFNGVADKKIEAALKKEWRMIDSIFTLHKLTHIK